MSAINIFMPGSQGVWKYHDIQRCIPKHKEMVRKVSLLHAFAYSNVQSQPSFKKRNEKIIIIIKAARRLKPGAYHKASCGWAFWRGLNLEPMTVAASSIVFLNESFYVLLCASFATALVRWRLSPTCTHCIHCGTSSGVNHCGQARPTYWVPMKTLHCTFAFSAV